MCWTGEHDSVAGDASAGSKVCQSLVEPAALERAVPSPFEEAILADFDPRAMKNSNHVVPDSQARGPRQAREIGTELEFQSHGGFNIECQSGANRTARRSGAAGN